MWRFGEANFGVFFGDQLGDEFVIALKREAGTLEGLAETGIVIFKFGNQFVAQAVAEIIEGGVGGVFERGEVVGCAIGDRIGAPQMQNGTDEGNFGVEGGEQGALGDPF